MSESVPTPDPKGPARKPPKEAVAEAHVRAPTRGNRKLESFLAAINADDQVRAWWYMTQVHSERLGMSDHSWVHMQIVLNVALRLLRLLVKAGVEPAMVADHRMSSRDAEVVVAGGALLHDVGMSIHRSDHEDCDEIADPNRRHTERERSGSRSGDIRISDYEPEEGGEHDSERKHVASVGTNDGGTGHG